MKNFKSNAKWYEVKDGRTPEERLNYHIRDALIEIWKIFKYCSRWFLNILNLAYEGIKWVNTETSPKKDKK